MYIEVPAGPQSIGHKVCTLIETGAQPLQCLLASLVCTTEGGRSGGVPIKLHPYTIYRFTLARVWKIIAGRGGSGKAFDPVPNPDTIAAEIVNALLQHVAPSVGPSEIAEGVWTVHTADAFALWPLISVIPGLSDHFIYADMSAVETRYLQPSMVLCESMCPDYHEECDALGEALIDPTNLPRVCKLLLTDYTRTIIAMCNSYRLPLLVGRDIIYYLLGVKLTIASVTNMASNKNAPYAAVERALQYMHKKTTA
jgi:hypothetical protein